MKIKLSKAQWEELGKKTGWLKTADAQFTKRNNCLKHIFTHLPGNLHKTDRYSTYSVTQRDEAGMGTCWIQVYYNEWYQVGQDAFGVERYYESEFLQNEYGKTMYVLPNYDNPQETLDKILAEIQKLKENA